MDFGRVLGGFWEAKIPNFRIFFNIFSMQNFESIWKVKKLQKMDPKPFMTLFWARCCGACGPGGKDLGWGESLPKSEISSLTLEEALKARLFIIRIGL